MTVSNPFIVDVLSWVWFAWGLVIMLCPVSTLQCDVPVLVSMQVPHAAPPVLAGPALDADDPDAPIAPPPAQVVHPPQLLLMPRKPNPYSPNRIFTLAVVYLYCIEAWFGTISVVWAIFSDIDVNSETIVSTYARTWVGYATILAVFSLVADDPWLVVCACLTFTIGAPIVFHRTEGSSKEDVTIRTMRLIAGTAVMIAVVAVCRKSQTVRRHMGPALGLAYSLRVIFGWSISLLIHWQDYWPFLLATAGFYVWQAVHEMVIIPRIFPRIALKLFKPNGFMWAWADETSLFLTGKQLASHS